MLKTEVVDPNVGNFIDSIRDIGYSFEVAVADLIDNSLTAGCSEIKIVTVPNPHLVFSMLDNGSGMSEPKLLEAMRLASKNPKDVRKKNDLGRFGLGLKTASFSQCKKLTVITKKDGQVYARQWDIDYISQKNKWLLITPENFDHIPLLQDLYALESGTLVCWENIDRSDKHSFANVIALLRKHLSLVFHKYLEGSETAKAVKIFVNQNILIPFNPFNMNHPATQQLPAEKIRLYDTNIIIQPYILPHHSKLTQQEYDLYATEEGYIKSQGFYLYRENRILIYGTWWGLHKSLDAHKLVRIKIDIPNSIDAHWGIDIKKSIARPSEEIKRDLKRVIGQATEKGSRPYTGRGRKIEDKTIVQFWEILSLNDDIRFAVNQEHPLFRSLIDDLSAGSHRET
ncbi:ATP-binding protein [Mucilaginibacter sp.]|uniref:ATP-binding protein n=1 Tax=Mucilaginibacter sp. TaxID=1882438 RepID=UPI003AFFA937